MANNKSKTSTTKDGDDEVSDVSPKDLAKVDKQRSSGNLGSKGSVAFKGDADYTEHIDADGFRQTVENTAAGDLNWPPREPYPTGNPPDPREAFHRMHGYYQTDDGEKTSTKPGKAP